MGIGCQRLESVEDDGFGGEEEASSTPWQSETAAGESSTGSGSEDEVESEQLCMVPLYAVGTGATAHAMRTLSRPGVPYPDILTVVENRLLRIRNDGRELAAVEPILESEGNISGIFVEPLEVENATASIVLVREYVDGLQSFRVLTPVGDALVETALFPNAAKLVMADVDGDGKQDAVVMQFDLYTRAYRGLGDGGFEELPRATAGLWTLASDVTGDGLADLVVLNDGRSGVFVHPGTGDGGFERSLQPVWADPLLRPADALTFSDDDGATMVVRGGEPLDGALGPSVVIVLEPDGAGGWAEAWRSTELGDVWRFKLEPAADDDAMGIAVVADKRLHLFSASAPIPLLAPDVHCNDYWSAHLYAGEAIVLWAGPKLHAFVSTDSERWVNHSEIATPGAVGIIADIDGDGVDEILTQDPDGFTVNAVEPCL